MARRQQRGQTIASAVEAKLFNPNMMLMEALVVGDFAFQTAKEGGKNNRDVKDEEGMSLYQRENQLCRKLRKKGKCNP